MIGFPRPRRLSRPTTRAGKALFFAAGLVLAAAGVAVAYWIATVFYGGGNYALAQASTLSAPTSATATEASATSVTIGWTNPGSQVAGATYKVTRSPGTVVVCHTVSGPTCTDSSLTPGTTYTYSVVATSGTKWHSSAATATFTTLGVTTTSLPHGTVGLAYTTTLTAVGGTGADTWSLASGTLPSWASLTSSTGKITGTPTAAGTTTGLKFKVTDSKSYSATSTTLSLTVTKANTSFTIKVTGGSIKTVTFGAQATLSETGLPATGTGTLTFKSASTVTLCSVALTVATHCKTSATLAAGTYTIHATYAGTSNYNGSTSTNHVTLSVLTAAKTSSISLNTISSPKTYGTEGQTFTGTVTGVASFGNPSTGTVTVKTTGGTTLCTTSTFTASGTHAATFSCVQTTGFTLAASGTAYVVHANYSGGNSSTATYTYNGSTSATQTLTVNKAAKVSSISLNTISSPKTYGTEGQTFTGTVIGSVATANPSTGTVTVKTTGGTTLCTTSTLTAAGTHSATYSCVQSTGSLLPASGTAYVVHANYSGGNTSTTNYTYNGSTSLTRTLTVNKAAKATSISLNTITSPKTYGSEGQTFTGKVTGVSGDGNPSTGTVTVKTSTTVTLCTTSTLTATGTFAATYSCVQTTGSKLAASGTAYVLHASYTGGNSTNGNFTYNGSTSATQNLTVNKANTSFTIKVTGGSTKTITFGAQATLSETGLPAAGTGLLTFKTAATVTLCTVALTVATHCQTSATLAAGTYVIHATYAGTTNYNSSTSTNHVTLTVNKAAKVTSISLNTITSPKTYGSEGQTFTGKVTGVSGDGNPSTGTVTVKTSTTVTLCTTSTLTATGTFAATYSCVQTTGSKLAASGTAYVLHASYTGGNSTNGNFTYNGSTSATQNLTVNKANTSFTIKVTGGSTKTITFGAQATLSETGLPAAGTGLLTFKTAATVTLCTVALTVATHCQTSATLAAGTYVIHATYAGTTNYNSSTSTNHVTLTVNKAAKATSISLNTITSPKTYGSEGQTFTGKVTGVSGDGNPSTGTVTVKTSTTVTLCTTSTLTATGTFAATYSCVQTTGSKLAASGTAYVLHASYTGGNSTNGNFTYNGSTSATQNLTVNKANTSFTIKVTGGSTKTITFGAQATLSETGLPAAGTGLLTFKTAATVTLCTVALTVATHCQTSATLAAGTYVIHATYAGTTNYNSSTSTNHVTLTVNKAAKATSISLNTITSPKTYGSEGQTFTGKVTGVSGDGNPSTGTVTVKTSTTVTLCTTSTLTATGTFAATYSCVQTTGSKLAASGTAYVLHASYTGGNSTNGNFTYNGSTSATQNLTVNKANTSFTIKVTGGSTKTITFGAQATLSETGLPAAGTGLLTFKTAATVTLCTVALTVATHCQTSATLAAGTYVIHATYAGTTNYNSSTSTNHVTLTVNKAAKATSISLNTITSPKTYGSEGQTFTGKVTGVSGDGNPSTGTVTVKTSTTVTLCTTSTLTATGTFAATYSCVQTTGSKLAASGTAYVLHASYTGGNSTNGNFTYNGSTSATQNLTVNKANTSFTIKVTGGSTKTITFGAQATLSETGLPAAGTGLLTFKTAATVTLCTVALTVATHCQTSATLAAGTYVIHATYAGTTNYNSSTSTNHVTLTVNKAAKATSISLNTITSPKTYGSEGQTFTGKVTGVSGDGNPSTGTVTVKTSTTVTLCTTSTLTATGTFAATYSCVQTTGSKLAASGTAYVLHASYTGGNSTNGNFTYNGSTSATQNLTVNKANTSFTIKVTGGSTKTITFGAQATLSETGLPATGTGLLTFKTAATVTLCTVALTVATHCQTSATLAAGTYVIHATYAGTTNYNSSTSTNHVTLTVNKAAKATSISLNTITSPKTYGSEGQTFTGKVTGVSGDGNPSTGTVTVKTSTTVTLCTTSTLTATGTFAATYSCVQTTGSKLAASGTAYVLHASYTGGNSTNGNFTYNGSTSATQNLTVNPANGVGTMTVTPTSVTVSSSHTYTFTYTAATAMTSGEVTVAVPTTWTTPQTTTSTSAGYTTESGGGGTVAYTGTNHLITVTGVTLSSGSSLTITYGGGTSATKAKAPSSPGLTTFTTQQKSLSGGTLTNLASSPKVTVKSASSACATQATVTVAASTTENVTLIGAGGGNGAKNGSTATGGSGAGGAKYSGTIDNTNASPVTLKVTVGCAGASSTNMNGGHHVTGSNYATGGDAGNGGGTGGGGGAGGAASAIKITGGATILVAGGGGGGGGAAGSSAGSAGSSSYSTKASNSAKTGGNGSNGSGANNGGGGAGGGGVTTVSTAGTGGANTSGGGGGNGFSYSATSGGVTVTMSGPVSGANGAANGSYSFSGGLPVITSASSTTFTKSVSGAFTFTATGAPTPTITNAAFTGCTPSTLPGTLTFHTGSGTAKITGTPTATATYTLCITATNTVGTATQKFTLTVSVSVVGTVTTWTSSGSHAAKPVKYPATAVTGDLLFLIVVGNQEPGPAGHPLSGWHTGDMGAGVHPTQIHGNVFWRVDAGGTSVTVTPYTKATSNSAAWIVAFNPGGTPTVATSVATCKTPPGACGYGGTPTATFTPTMVATNAPSATEYSIVMDPSANTLTLTTANSFTLAANGKVSYGSSQGDAFAIATKSIPTSGTTPAAPVWKQSGTAKQWAWVTLAFT